MNTLNGSPPDPVAASDATAAPWARLADTDAFACSALTAVNRAFFVLFDYFSSKVDLKTFLRVFIFLVRSSRANLVALISALFQLSSSKVVERSGKGRVYVPVPHAAVN